MCERVHRERKDVSERKAGKRLQEEKEIDSTGREMRMGGSIGKKVTLIIRFLLSSTVAPPIDVGLVHFYCTHP